MKSTFSEEVIPLQEQRDSPQQNTSRFPFSFNDSYHHEEDGGGNDDSYSDGDDGGDKNKRNGCFFFVLLVRLLLLFLFFFSSHGSFLCLSPPTLLNLSNSLSSFNYLFPFSFPVHISPPNSMSIITLPLTPLSPLHLASLPLLLSA